MNNKKELKALYNNLVLSITTTPELWRMPYTQETAYYRIDVSESVRINIEVDTKADTIKIDDRKVPLSLWKRIKISNMLIRLYEHRKTVNNINKIKQVTMEIDKAILCSK